MSRGEFCMNKRLLISLFFFVSLLTISFSQYLLKPGDQIEVYNYTYPELNQTALVGKDGYIQLKLIGSVKAEGMTLEELAASAKNQLSAFAPESRVTILLTGIYPLKAYIIGEVSESTAIDVTYEESPTLLQALSFCGGVKASADLKNILLRHEDGSYDTVDISETIEYGRGAEGIALHPGDVIVVPRKYDRRVYVFGSMEQSGVIYFEEKEPMVLEVLLSKIKFDLRASEPTIVLIRDGREITLALDGAFPQVNKTELRSNDILLIRKLQPKYLYVTGLADTNRVDFDREEEMTLQTVFGKLGIAPVSPIPLRIIHTSGIEKTVIVDRPVPVYRFETGDIVEFPPQNYVYVSGNVSRTGRIEFAYSEPFTVETLLALVGVGEKEIIQLTIIHPDGQRYLYRYPERKGTNTPLERGAFVQFPYKRYVFFAGSISEGNERQLFFPNEEEMTLKRALAKAAVDISQYNYRVTVIRNQEQYPFDLKSALLSEGEFYLETGDILFFERDTSRYVHLVVSDGESRKFHFTPEEPLDLITLLTKYEKTGELTGDQIKIIDPSGRIFLSSVKAVLNQEENYDLSPKSLIVINANERRVFVLGNVEKSGEILFGRDEPFTMTTLVAKCNPFLDEKTESILVKQSDKVTTLDLKEVLDVSTTLTLEKDAVVYFKPYEPKVVTIFGQVKNPGLLTFDAREPLNLMTVLSKSGGLLTDASQRVKVIGADGKTLAFNLLTEPNPERLTIAPGSYIVVENNQGQYIAILGDVKQPGLHFLQKEEITLLELLSARGGVSDWTLNTTLELSRASGEKEIINIDLDPSALSMKKVRSGDTVFVYPSNRLKVYVFGAVVNPGIVPYRSKMTLLESLLYCKGPASSAYMKKIMVFPGGVDANPILLDYSGFRKEQGVADYFLEPGDVVYVPQSALVEIKDIAGFLGTMLTLVNSGFTLVDKLQNLP